MKKRLLSLFLAWAVCLTMLPAMALADEEPETEPAAQEQTAEEPESEPVAQSEDDAEPTMDEAKFRDAVAAGGEVKLTGNVTLTSAGAENSALPRVTVQKDVQLDLMGYTITANFNDYVFFVSASNNSSTDFPTLTLDDTVGGGKITHGTYADDSGAEKTYIGSGVYVYRGNFVMNGGTITGNVSTGTDAAGVDISSSSGNNAGSTFTMTGGAITGNRGARTGGVSLFTNGAYNQCTFTMTGGTISGNQATGCNWASVGGVYLNSSVFTMTGGSITGNNSTVTDTSYSTTGGVLATSSVLQPAVTVGGTAQICDNWIGGEKSGDSYVKGDNGAADNVYLGTSNSTISISDTTLLTSDAKIGVTTNTEPTSGANVSFATGASEADKAYFFSDKGNGIVYNSDSEQLEMQAVAHSHDDGEGFMHTLKSADGALVIDSETQNTVYYSRNFYELPAGSYVLADNTDDASNLELDNPLLIRNGAEVSICLNGKNIHANVSSDTIWLINNATLTVTDCNTKPGTITHADKKTGCGLWVHNSTFKLHGGVISGNDSRNTSHFGGGGVVLETDGSGSSKFEMTGGSITKNSANNGGGVYVQSGCKFEMTGGSIIDNYVTTGNKCGGVYLNPNNTPASMTVSGAAQICDSYPNNIWGRPITIGEGGLTEGAKIYLSPSTTLADGEYKTIATNVDAESAKHIFCDNTEYTLFRNAEDKTLVLFNGTPHAHKICGDASCTDRTEDVLFESKLYVENGTLKATGKDITTGGTDLAPFYTLPAGHYYLDSDIELDKRLSFKGAVTICLNGHSIKSKISTQVLDINGDDTPAVTLTNCQTRGEITRTIISPNNGTGIYVYHQGTFNMYGGTITGHTRGITIDNGTFNMYGGSITGNARTANNGAGVYVYNNNSTMNIRGKVNITGNTVAGVENNVYLPSGKTITVDGQLDAASLIGVSTDLSSKPESVDIAKATDASYVSTSNFLSDDSTYHVGIEGNTVKLMAHAHEWAYTASGATITATCTASDYKSTNGGSVTVSAPTHTVYRDNKDANAVVKPGSDWAAAAISDLSVTYDGGSTTPPTDAGNHTASISLTGVDGKTATANVAYTIGKATLTADDFTFTAPDANDLVYNGKAKTVSVTSDDVTDSDITVHYFRDRKEVSPINAGDYTFTIDVKETKNFEKAAGLTKDGVWTFTITPADLNVSSDQNVNIRYTDTAEKTYTASDFGITVGGAFFERGNVTDASSVLETDYPKIENGAVRVKLKSGLELNNQTVTIPLRFLPNSTNYNAKEITLTITLSEKDAQEPLEITSTGEMSYNDTLTLTAKGGSTDSAVKWSVADGTGKARIDENGVLIPEQVGTVTITATKPGDDQYSDVSDTQTITINKATITITAKDQTAKVGDEKAPDLAGQYEITGLAQGETLKTLPTIAYAETPDLTKAGTVAIVVSGAEVPDGGNYSSEIV